MSIPGIDSVGRLAIGQLSQSYGTASANLGQAAGIGAAGPLAASDGALLIGASGTGTAGSFGKSVSIGITQAAGSGVAAAVLLANFSTIGSASGTAVAGSFANLVQAFPLEAFGTGVAGTVLGQSTAPNLAQASGIGVANQIGPSGTQFGAACVGISGVIIGVLSGGGGSPYKPRYGLEPIKKRPKPPEQPRPKVSLPPALRGTAPPIAPRETTPIDDIEYAHHDLRSLEARIMEAKRATERQRQDEAERRRQDEADIADIKAILELLD
jgi:hypothetical protein